MRKPATLLALTAALLITPAAAEHTYVDTDVLYGWCKPYVIGGVSPPKLCAGYINAVADILAHGEAIHGQRACVPDTVSLSDIRDLVVGAIDGRPNEGKKSAHDWVAEVLAGAYPCAAANR